ncbi:MAG: universal stress protein [Desulfobacterales bacterium]|nr:universal stress protein [Desulfobacterales bacterium]
MGFERILFHTRFRETAFEALTSLLALKAVGLKTVVLTYVIPREAVAFVPYGGYLKAEEDRIRQEAGARFAQWQKDLTARGIQSTVRIETGAANAELLRVAEEEQVDLIVTGSKKRTSFEKVYVGAHILDILRRSPIPVMMGKYMVTYESDGERLTRVNDRLFERPMLASDWSDPAQRGLDALVALGPLVERALVVHVIGNKLASGRTSEDLAALENESRQRLAASCRRLTEAGLSAGCHLGRGKSAAEIVRLSRAHGASMIVMGRTGKDWFQEYFLGGVSHRVAEHSELPVMLVP